MTTTFDQEIQAIQALGKLMVDAKAVASKYVQCGMPIPQPLARILGEPDDHAIATSVERTPTRSSDSRRPMEAEDGWMSVPMDALASTGAVLAILRDATSPITTKELVKRLKAYNTRISHSTLYNIGSRLQADNILERTNGLWSVINKAHTPMVFEHRAWGPSEVFTSHEIAAHRRELIVEHLRANTAGLTTMQVVMAMDANAMCLAPKSKDNIMADMKALEKSGVVRRIKRMWRVVDE